MTDNNQQNGFYENNENPNNQNFGYVPQQPVEEKASVGLAILSFLIPLAGLIIFLVNKDKKPKTAKTSGICALVSFILNIVMTVIIYATMFAGVGAAVGSLADDIDLDSDSSYSQDVSAEDGTQSDGNVLDGNTIGDYGCVVKSATLCKDWTDKDAVLVTYEFTNNSSDSISFDVALDAKAFQDGVGLETAILDSDETDYLDVEIKPGVTKEVRKAYVLRDTSTDVEIEISELISFSDDKLVSTVKIAQ